MTSAHFPRRESAASLELFLDEIILDLPMPPGADLLQRVALFKTLRFEETLALSAISHVEAREDGDVILHQDSLGQALFILKKGKAAVRRRDPITGEERELATLCQGELFGEMSLIEDQLVSANVVAQGAVEILVIPRREFHLLLGKNEQLAIKVYRCFCHALSEKLRRANQKLAEANANAAAGKKTGS